MATKGKSVQDSTAPTCLAKGAVGPLSEQDQELIAEYRRALASCGSAAGEKAFATVIVSSNERCGFGSFGRYYYLLNTDSGHRYRVTVREFWLQTNNSGQNDRTFICEPGSRVYLGCNYSGEIPTMTTSWQIVGEQRIS
jgi:hypothetical protein